MVRQANENKGISLTFAQPMYPHVFLSAVCSSFNFSMATGSSSKATKHLALKRAPAKATVWDDNVARCMFSDDNLPLVYHLPLFLRDASNVRVP